MNKWPKRDVLKMFHYNYFIIYLIPLFPLRGNEVSTHQNYETTPPPPRPRKKSNNNTKQNKTKQQQQQQKNKWTITIKQLSLWIILILLSFILLQMSSVMYIGRCSFFVIKTRLMNLN